MIIRILVIAFFLFIASHIAKSRVASNKYDSLIQLSKSGSLSDLQSFLVLKKLSAHSWDGILTLDQRIDFLERALYLVDVIDSVELIISSYNELGRLYWIDGSPEKSMQAVYSLIEIAKGSKNIYWEGTGYNNLANAYKSQKDYTNAYELERKAIELFKQIDDSLTIYTSITSHIETLYKLGRLDECEQKIEEAYLFYIENDYGFEYTKAYLCFSESFLRAIEGNYDSAIVLLDYSTNVLSPYKNRELEQTIALSNAELGSIFMDAGKAKEAREMAVTAYEIGTTNKLNEVIRDASELLYKIYEELGDYHTSNEYLKSYYAYRDSIVNIENVKKIESLRADFAINEKQVEVELLNTQKKARDIALGATGLVLLVFVVAVTWIYRNYREKNKLSKELAVQKDNLENLNASKDKLFSILSHDLRGPMSAFKGVSTIIEMAVTNKNTDLLLELAEQVRKTSHRLSDLLENLLTWAIREQGEFEPQPVKLEIKQIFDQLHETYESLLKEKSINLQLEAAQDTTVYADRNMTETIFRNLLSNAVKFTPENGTIQLMASKSDTGTIRVKVSDTGVGIPNEKLGQIFDFKGQKSEYGTKGEKGLGLGLSLVKEFVSMNNGEITVNSKVNEGTTFEVLLPAA